MIFEDIKSWPGGVELNGVFYSSVAEAAGAVAGDAESIHSIVLCTRTEKTPQDSGDGVAALYSGPKYKVTVKSYMTRRATGEFNFMEIWNDNIPMPLRTMVGYKLDETRGMIRMSLWGDIVEEKTSYCLKCGRLITNPVSQYFGMGPECGGHNYINPFDTEDELKAAVMNYRTNVLRKLTWTGWIIKSAIIEEEIIDGDIS